MTLVNIPFSYNKVDCKRLRKSELIKDLLMEIEKELIKHIDAPTEIRGALNLVYNQKED